MLKSRDRVHEIYRILASSFHLFAGIYTKRFPCEAPALMKYCETIQDLAGRGHNWKYYDENGRFFEADPSFSPSLGSDL